MTIDELKSQLARLRIRPDKRLGQNFLLSEQVLDEIITAAELKNTDTVLEIGPGLGVLTRRLAEQAGQVIAIEKDRNLAQLLRRQFRNNKNVKIINEDALFFDPSVILNSRPPRKRERFGQVIQDPDMASTAIGDWIPGQARNDKPFSFKVVANIPYYITGKLLQNLLTSEFRLSLMVLLLQKEVAQRIVARAGEMSLLSVSVQYYSDPEIISVVGRENFYPKPEVDSAIVRFKVLEKPRFPPSLSPSPQGRGKEEWEREFFWLVKIGFSNKRKQLQNNLTSLPSSPHELGRGASLPRRWGGNEGEVDYKKVLQSIGLNPLCRAQDLSLEDWNNLYHALNKKSI